MRLCEGWLGAMALAIIVSTAMGQQLPRVPRPVSGGPLFGNPIELLRRLRVHDAVRKELAISEEQAKQIEEAFRPLSELDGDFWEAQNLQPEERRPRMQALFKKGVEESKLAEEKVKDILTPEQVVRFKQLWLQWLQLEGVPVLTQPETAKELGLTKEQQQRIREIQASSRAQPLEHKFEDLSEKERQQYYSDQAARKEKANAAMLAELTAEQKAKFAEMKGKEFPFPPLPPGVSAGRPGAGRPQPAPQSKRPIPKPQP